MVEFKRAVVRALGTTGTGVLLDPEIGVAPAIADGSLPGRAGLIVAVEATGYEGERGARVSRVLPGWGVGKIKRLGASAAKLLVYYHPDAPNAAAQERLVAEVADACRAEDLALFLEPLSFGLDGGKLAGEDRRRVVVETARRLTAIGADVLKAEFPYDAGVTDEGRWREACAELDAATPVPWVLLSGGVDDATFERQVRVACEAGASGVLVGRSVWAEAAAMAPAERDRFLGRRTAGRGSSRLTDARRRVSGRPGGRAGRRPAGPRRPAPAGTSGTEVAAATSTSSSSARSTPTSSSGTATRGRCSGRPSGSSRAIRLTIGSSSAITACGAARLGLAVSLVGVVGDDALGRFTLDALADRGVDVSACRVAPGRATGASVILGNGTDRAILTRDGHDRRRPGGRRPARRCSRAPGTSTSAATSSSRAWPPSVPALFRAARAAGATTSLDPNWDPSGAWDGGLRARRPRRPTCCCRTRRSAARWRASRTSRPPPLALASVRRRVRVARSPSSAAPTAGSAVGPDGALARAARDRGRRRRHDRRRRLVRRRVPRGLARRPVARRGAPARGRVRVAVDARGGRNGRPADPRRGRGGVRAEAGPA